MAPWNRKHEKDPALRAASSTSKPKARCLERLQRRLGKGRRARPDAGPAAPASDSGSPGHPVPGACPPTDHKDVSTTQSLWDRAYDALGKGNPQLVEEYEALLSKEAQKMGSTSNGGLPTQAMPPDDATDGQSRPAQLDTIITRGLQRVEEKKTKYTIAGHEFVLKDQIAQAAGLVLWAKDWIGNAVKASPEASIAWAGVCLILPLLTNPKTAGEANRDGFAYVTTRMRYYAAFEPMLLRLGQNSGVTDALMAEANGHIEALYQCVLEFQIRSVLRFYQSHLGRHIRDMVLPKDWKQMRLDIEKREATVNGNLTQINEFASRQELESLNKTSMIALDNMHQFLSVAEQQLRVTEEHRDIAGEHRDIAGEHRDIAGEHRGIAEEQLQAQKDMAKQMLSDKEERCHQLFRLTAGSNDATYEWYKNRVENRVEGTCQWFLQHKHFTRWLAQESGPLLVSADPGCGKSVLAKYLIDEALPRSATICYFFFKDQDQNTISQALCALLHQLFFYQPSLIRYAMPEYSKDGERLSSSISSL